ncbi:hypothetical protein BJ742DRAFT_736607 [Cladochytrium replicatum]|nr:hypothetical protein BJ742DRAFT_736607 [Cladochytrium replicatum]
MPKGKSSKAISKASSDRKGKSDDKDGVRRRMIPTGAILFFASLFVALGLLLTAGMGVLAWVTHNGTNTIATSSRSSSGRLLHRSLPTQHSEMEHPTARLFARQDPAPKQDNSTNSTLPSFLNFLYCKGPVWNCSKSAASIFTSLGPFLIGMNPGFAVPIHFVHTFFYLIQGLFLFRAREKPGLRATVQRLIIAGLFVAGWLTVILPVVFIPYLTAQFSNIIVTYYSIETNPFPFNISIAINAVAMAIPVLLATWYISRRNIEFIEKKELESGSARPAPLPSSSNSFRPKKYAVYASVGSDNVQREVTPVPVPSPPRPPIWSFWQRNGPVVVVQGLAGRPAPRPIPPMPDSASPMLLRGAASNPPPVNPPREKVVGTFIGVNSDGAYRDAPDDNMGTFRPKTGTRDRGRGTGERGNYLETLERRQDSRERGTFAPTGSNGRPKKPFAYGYSQYGPPS